MRRGLFLLSAEPPDPAQPDAAKYVGRMVEDLPGRLTP